jgi:2-keto-3-deoxy-L-arabinonate dehydratase
VKNQIKSGIYPMLYSFFCETGSLRLEPFLMQVDAVIAAGCTGISILGLGTEVGKLSFDERVKVLKLVSNRIAGRCQLMVTVCGDKPDEQVVFANIAIDHGASWLVLQPPSVHCNEEDLSKHFSKIISSVPFPVGIQNAPDFLGFGLTSQSILNLVSQHDNFVVAKLECSAVELEGIVQKVGSGMAIFNGRCGLELPENLRAGATGIVPGIETADKHEHTYQLFVAGNQKGADAAHSQIAPVISFIMQGIPHFLTYGKTIAALRLGIDVGGSRQPHLSATAFGKSISKRFATHLGPLVY